MTATDPKKQRRMPAAYVLEFDVFIRGRLESRQKTVVLAEELASGLPPYRVERAAEAAGKRRIIDMIPESRVRLEWRGTRYLYAGGTSGDLRQEGSS